MPERRILMGVLGRPHGVRGLLHVASYTADPADLTAYGPLTDARGRRFALAPRAEGVVAVSELVDGAAVPVADRDAAARLTNVQLFVDRNALPAPEAEEFYLADLIGLAAQDRDGMPVGRVAAVHDYGAGASLEIARDAAPALLLPFTRACVPDIDVAAGLVVVDLPDETSVPDEASVLDDAAGAALTRRAASGTLSRQAGEGGARSLAREGEGRTPLDPPA